MWWKYKNLQDRIDCLEKDNSSLKRILENYKPGEITYKSNYTYGICLDIPFSGRYHYSTYIYKNGKEYSLGDIFLMNPKFKEIDEDTIIIRDKAFKKKYIFQLSTSKLLEVEWEKSKEKSKHTK